ncbi:MAG: response regulator transcription factor [Roseiflexaceae bacterium]|nr:response regulator transcription factor [Roseiflexaceae bacterium]
MTVQICIVSGSAERRAALKAVLGQVPNVAIAGEMAESAALRLLVPLAPDLVIIDAATPGLNPITLLQMPLNMPVIVLAATERPNEQQLFQELGARAVVQPQHFDRLPSILSSIVGVADQGEDKAPQPLQRRRWAHTVSTVFTRH